jgi:hypothetical protein
LACPSTGESLPEILTPTVTPIANINNIHTTFLMEFLREDAHLNRRPSEFVSFSNDYNNMTRSSHVILRRIAVPLACQE